MGIAMHLAMKEKRRVQWAKQFYDVIKYFKNNYGNTNNGECQKAIPSDEFMFY